ncbi:restriction endonuclease subunit S [Kurthia gibsonii]|uniref:restriction endonuclease subunit S n=1 Tax=Kurthia gibsonii TaxID=33946 RepID=UPI0031B69E08
MNELSWTTNNKLWKVEPLKKIFSFEKGKNAALYTKEYLYDNPGEYPVYSGQTENNGVMGLIDSFDYNLNECLFTTTVGAKVMTVAHLKGKFSLSQNCLIMIPKNNDFNIRFYYYQLMCLFNYEKALIPSHMQPSLRMEDLKKYKILSPNILMQDKIVAYLDNKINNIDSLIENQTNLIKLLNQQRQSIITEAVTKGLNPNVKMKDSGVEWIGEIPEHWYVNKIKFKFDIRKVIQPTENPTVLSLTQHGLKIKDLKDFSGQHAESYDKYQKVEIKDYVMNGMDLLTGYVDCSPFEGVTSPDYRVFRIKDDTECHDYYLRYFQICYFAKIFYGHGQGVSNFGRWRLQTDVFKEFPLPVPSKEEQFEISEYLKNKEEEIGKSLDLLKVNIEKLKEYRQSLIYEAVTGKIDVRDMELD